MAFSPYNGAPHLRVFLGRHQGERIDDKLQGFDGVSFSALISVLRGLRHALAAMLLLWLVPLAAAAGSAAPVSGLSPPAHPLGQHMAVLSEAASPLALADVMRLVGTDRFVAASSEVIGLGIGHRPIWTHLVVENPTDQAVARYLAIGPTWIDRFEVHLVHAGQEAIAWHTGDAVSGAPHLDEALGYVFEYRFPPGRSELFIRAATADPLVLDVRLLTADRVSRTAAIERYAYGFYYGFLCALIIYNLVLYLTLGRRNGLFYSIYLTTFAVLNLAYTGRGLAWLWSTHPELQRYVILALMVLTASAGLRFAREFLEIDQRSPRLGRALRWAGRTILAVMLAMIVAGLQEAAAWFAFMVMAAFVFAMIGLGIYAVGRRQNAAGYFLVAAVASMAGVGLTLFSVWGAIPFNAWTYRGMEVGVMLDATLLSLALAKFVRTQMQERQRAERDARIDPLTQLLNRRGFYEQAESSCGVALRYQRPLSLVLLDLDDFKSVNDRFGHAVGDLVLMQTGEVLAKSIRRGDILARWGGEEFILLLPETDLDAAADFAERIRTAIAELLIARDDIRLQVTASFGVGQLAAEQDLNGLIGCVDKRLYAAKGAGRNRVMKADAVRVGLDVPALGGAVD